MLYLIFKTLHVLSGVVFLGNILTGVFWKRHADRTRWKASSSRTGCSPYRA